MMISKLQKEADFAELSKDIDTEYLNDITSKSPEYLLDIIAQIVEILLLKIKVPRDEAEAFSGKVKERHMGELFANFEAYDVQETRRIAREEGIKKVVQVVKAIVNSQTSARQQLMEQYELSEEEAEKKVELYW